MKRPKDFKSKEERTKVFQLIENYALNITSSLGLTYVISEDHHFKFQEYKDEIENYCGSFGWKFSLGRCENGRPKIIFEPFDSMDCYHD